MPETIRTRRLHLLLTISVLFAGPILAQPKPVVWSDREKPIYEQIRTLRSVPDDKRGAVTSNSLWRSAASR